MMRGAAILVVAHGAFAQDSATHATGALRTGDVINLRVYRDSELSGKYVIDAQGNVQIPGLGILAVGGLDAGQVNERLLAALRDKGFRAPDIAVAPEIRVSVLGEVRVPALYSVAPGASLIQVLTMAGGPTDRANLKKARIVRDGRVIAVDFTQVLAGSTSGRLALYSNDVVYIPAKSGVFTQATITLLTSVLSIALSAVTLIQVTRH